MSESNRSAIWSRLTRITFEFLALIILAAGTSAGADANDEHRTLTIAADGRKCEFHAAELLKHPELETITIQDVSAYPRQTVTFSAIKMAALLKCMRIEDESRLEFIAQDGFTANLAASALLNTMTGKAVAYLAVENPEMPWAPHGSGAGTAGPFYVFWKNPQLSNIGREEWPFKFNRVVVKGTLESIYPEIVPDSSAPGLDRLLSGFNVYVKNCLACHKLNRVGPGSMGPDLNYPLSATRYFNEGILRMYIRDPQSVRAHPRSAMGPFPPELISDAELDDLIGYLNHMAGRKAK